MIGIISPYRERAEEKFRELAIFFKEEIDRKVLIKSGSYFILKDGTVYQIIPMSENSRGCALEFAYVDARTPWEFEATIWAMFKGREVKICYFE